MVSGTVSNVVSGATVSSTGVVSTTESTLAVVSDAWESELGVSLSEHAPSSTAIVDPIIIFRSNFTSPQ